MSWAETVFDTVMIARMVTAAAKIIPRTNGSLAGSDATVPPPRAMSSDFRGANWKRCVSYLTPRWLSKK
jgi:hypothetical protein